MHGALFSSLYLFVLGGHFLYAYYLLKAGRVSLAFGRFRTPRRILTALLLINGVSLLAFVYPRDWWVFTHIVFHAGLAVTELVMTTKVRSRWPFFVNHLFFIWVLYLYSGTLIET